MYFLSLRKNLYSIGNQIIMVKDYSEFSGSWDSEVREAFFEGSEHAKFHYFYVGSNTFE